MRTVTVLLALTCVACLAPGAGNDAAFDDDAGAEVDNLCADAGPDAGPECRPGNNPEDALCSSLIVATCEPTCQESAACAAATLVSQYEPFRCEAALADAQTFPHCGATPCENLVVKACGAADECADAPGCDPSKELHARSIDANASTEEIVDAIGACTQALEDEVVFAPCNGT